MKVFTGTMHLLLAVRQTAVKIWAMHARVSQLSEALPKVRVSHLVFPDDAARLHIHQPH